MVAWLGSTLALSSPARAYDFTQFADGAGTYDIPAVWKVAAPVKRDYILLQH